MSPFIVIKSGPVQIALHDHAGLDRGLEMRERLCGVCDAPSVVAGCNSILRDQNRYATGDLPGSSNRDSERIWTVRPAGQGVVGVVGMGDHTVRGTATRRNGMCCHQAGP